MLQPVGYDPKMKNKHKFLVQSMYAPEDAVENKEALVSTRSD